MGHLTKQNIGHPSNMKIPQMPDASGGFFCYNGSGQKQGSEVHAMQILVADHQPRVRFGLRVFLERQPGLTVVGEATSAEELLAQAEVTGPDLILLDWELPGYVFGPPGPDSSTPSVRRLVEGVKGLAGGDPSASSGQVLLSALRAVRPDLPVIVLSGRSEMRRAALGAGSDAFVSKCDPPERLLAAIQGCARQDDGEEGE
jgi:DNA-binding NarL/FixJ family response regulator